MPTIECTSYIKSNLEDAFGASLDVDLHKLSTSKTKEKVVNGINSGVMKLNDTVTWSAIHFGVRQKFTSKITAYNFPYSFTDEMQKGIFKSFKHEHFFTQEGEFVKMVDYLHFISPLGYFGKLANVLFLTNYLKRILEERNKTLKDHLEQKI